jgi:cyclic pyranopterin phosphate synthase
MPLLDAFGRPLRSLRVSVTDRCNIRCAYCMPEQEYVWLPRQDLLSFEEIERVVRVFASLGVERVRLTGGEPLLRRNLPDLVGRLASIDSLEDLALTTNGVLLAPVARDLKRAGLGRITVSLDTLHSDRFRALTRFDAHAQVLAGVEAAREVFGTLKLDTVVVRGLNDDEIVPMVEYARAHDAEVRFIEYMDVGGATRWSADQVVSRAQILDVLRSAFGAVEPILEPSSAPAERFRLPDGTTVGIVASTTAPFCRTCDRGRLTADGMWLLCLYATAGLDLRTPLRGGADEAGLGALVRERWGARTDRGAEDRLALHERTALLPTEHLRRNVHMEMHTRGG